MPASRGAQRTCHALCATPLRGTKESLAARRILEPVRHRFGAGIRLLARRVRHVRRDSARGISPCARGESRTTSRFAGTGHSFTTESAARNGDGAGPALRSHPRLAFARLRKLGSLVAPSTSSLPLVARSRRSAHLKTAVDIFPGDGVAAAGVRVVEVRHIVSCQRQRLALVVCVVDLC